MKKTLMVPFMAGLSCTVYAESNFNYDAVALNFEQRVNQNKSASNDFELDSLNLGIGKEFSHQLLLSLSLGYAWADEVQYGAPYRFKIEGEALLAEVSLGRYFVINERVDVVPSVSVAHSSSDTTVTVQTYVPTLVAEPRSKRTHREMLTMYDLSLAANVSLGPHQKWTLTPEIIYTTNDSDSDTDLLYSLLLAGRVTSDIEINGQYRFDPEEDFFSYGVGVRYFY